MASLQASKSLLAEAIKNNWHNVSVRRFGSSGYFAQKLNTVAKNFVKPNSSIGYSRPQFPHVHKHDPRLQFNHFFGSKADISKNSAHGASSFNQTKYSSSEKFSQGISPFNFSSTENHSTKPWIDKLCILGLLLLGGKLILDHKVLAKDFALRQTKPKKSKLPKYPLGNIKDIATVLDMIEKESLEEIRAALLERSENLHLHRLNEFDLEEDLRTTKCLWDVFFTRIRWIRQMTSLAILHQDTVDYDDRIYSTLRWKDEDPRCPPAVPDCIVAHLGPLLTQSMDSTAGTVKSLWDRVLELTSQLKVLLTERCAKMEAWDEEVAFFRPRLDENGDFLMIDQVELKYREKLLRLHDEFQILEAVLYDAIQSGNILGDGMAEMGIDYSHLEIMQVLAPYEEKMKQMKEELAALNQRIEIAKQKVAPGRAGHRSLLMRTYIWKDKRIARGLDPEDGGGDEEPKKEKEERKPRPFPRIIVR